MTTIAQEGLQMNRDRLLGLEAEVEEHLAGTWDYEAEREWALDPETEVGAEEFAAVWDAINYKLLTLTVGSVAVLFGDPEASAAMESELREAAFDLFLLVANPETRYTLVAGLRPELRDVAAAEMEAFGRELWGTAVALTAPEVDLEEFPPETAENIALLAEQRAAVLEEQAAGGGDD